MKNVLNYQSSEYDCGPVSLINALRFLFERAELSPDILKAISLYTLDTYNDAGEAGKHGTSRFAMQFLANWFNQYGRSTKFPIVAQFIENEQVFLSPTSAVTVCLQQGGAAVVHCFLGGDPHYVLLTAALGDRVGLFDPYYVSREDFEAENVAACGVELVEDRPRAMNRIVRASTLNRTDIIHYSMGPVNTREAMLIYNRRTRQTEANAVEYVI
ncbi:MAG: peptidase C39 [Clostridia bacterium]|nr:peptidase C39 [Clostridia bacterium]